MLRLLPIILVCLWLGAACSPSLVKVPSTDSSQPITPALRADASAIAYLIQAERNVVKGHFQGAVDQYRLALVHDPYSAQLHLRLARALRQLNQWFAAVEVLEKGLVARPDHAELRLALGRLYFEIEDFSSAEKTLKKIVPGEQAFQGAWLLRFESALWMNRLELIQEVRTELLHEMPDSACMLARLAEDHGREGLARMDYNRCPEPSDLALMRIDFRERGGELSERFKTLEPNETLNHPLSHTVLDSSRLYRRGVELRRAHRQKAGDCHILSHLGHWYGQNQDQVRSLRYLKEAYRRCPKNPAIVLTLAWAYLSHGQIERAVDLSKWILEQGFNVEYDNEALKVIERSDGPKTKEQ